MPFGSIGILGRLAATQSGLVDSGYHVGLERTTTPRGSSGMRRGDCHSGYRAVCAALAPRMNRASAARRGSSRKSGLSTSRSQRTAGLTARLCHS